MPKISTFIPPLSRAATATLVEGDGERSVEVVWTTGATVQRRRWEGWDDVVEFDEELVVEPGSVRLERMQAGAPFLDTHRGWSLASVLGSVVPGSVRIEGGRGFARVRLTEAPDAEPAIRRVLERHVSISVGYRVHRYEITRREGQREHWRAVDWEPLEISAVPMPADPGAHIRADETRPDALDRCLLIRAEAPTAGPAGHTRKTTMPDDHVCSTREPETCTAPVAAEPPLPAASLPAVDLDAARAEANRVASEILSICERHAMPQGFAADLIGRGLSLDQARAAVLDRLAQEDMVGARTAEPAPAAPRSTGSGDAAYCDAMTEALLHRSEPAVFTLTERARDFVGLKIADLARHTLERRGVSTRGLSNMQVLSEALFGRAGLHSTSDFPFILANVVNNALRRGYESRPRTFTAWARQRTIVDFKPVSVTQLGGAPDLLPVPESGEFTYGTISESREVYALLTYGRIIGITRQALISDQLDAFTRMSLAYGAAAAKLESEIVYSILTGNPNMADGQPLFHASHGNIGTAGAISETTLAEAYRMFGNQRGLDGRQISVLPRYIITPPGPRSVEARKNVTATTPSDVAGVNAFADRLVTVEEPRLIPESGPDPWFLAADPVQIDTVEFAYLEGQQGVYTETRTGFEVDGIEIKARHDFAAKAIDWRGLFRNAGA